MSCVSLISCISDWVHSRNRASVQYVTLWHVPMNVSLTTVMLFFYYQVNVIHVLFTVHWVHVNCSFPPPTAAH